MNKKTTSYKKILKKFPKVKLAYLFGSQAEGNVGVLSDYDFAVFLDENNVQKRFDIRLKLIDQLTRYLKTDKVDVVVLNDAESPELKYNIVSRGELMVEKEPFKVIIEPKILNEYFDFREGLKRYGLTNDK